MKSLSDIKLTFSSKTGEVLAEIVITAVRDFSQGKPLETAAILAIDESDAEKHGETIVQLKEAERYEYEIIPLGSNSDYRLRCTGAKRRKSLRQSADAGTLDTGSFCGRLLLELVDGEVSDSKAPVAALLIDVRSLKLGYRDQYRGMLRRLSRELAGLVVDCRQSTKTNFRSTFTERKDKGWTQIQLELLRETIDSKDFSTAIQRILSHPHEQLTDDLQRVSTSKPIRWSPSSLRQLAHGQPRTTLPVGCKLMGNTEMKSIASHVYVPQRIRDLDTSENRFIKHALQDVRAFLTHATYIFSAESGYQASAALAKRLGNNIDNWLSQAFFQNLGSMNLSPLGSPVLQRKAGYREVLQWWLRFHTAAELSWEGGEEVFKAGQRNVADLYEYWLFFEMLTWFYKTCSEEERPDIHELVEGLETDEPSLKLKKQVTLGPFKGLYAGQSRELQIRFSYNQKFKFTSGRSEAGSWTRNMHPDYTLTCWPAEFEEEEAEGLELLVHVHFDAKYRVENLVGLFGEANEDEVDQADSSGNYKRQDLLKMHAYRDAIKRSQGAYILYPGKQDRGQRMQGFHEILPGLGAFPVSPDIEGNAEGASTLHSFLEEILEHLGNRTTVMERSNYHLALSNETDDSGLLKEASVRYGNTKLPEKDHFEPSRPALPPSEHRVLVVWSGSDVDFEVWKEKNIAFVRLGSRPGSLHINEELFGVRHLLIRRNKKVFGGIKQFTKKGFKILTGQDVFKIYGLTKTTSNIYAVFEYKEDTALKDIDWDEEGIWSKIKLKDGTQNIHKRRSADPVVLTLQDLVKL